MYRMYIKRALDICCALSAIIVFCWLYLIVAILVRLKLGSPIIFKQPRPGKDEKIFQIYKFRSMSNATDQNGNLLSDEIRLGNFGKKLRALSIDELPQLFNILKGDMSFIGPRPLLIEYLPLYSKEQKRRHNVRPGITGLAQVNGRNAISWREKFEFDRYYADNLSLILDIKIALKTIQKVIKKDGVNKDGMATTEKFNGHN